MKLIIRLLSFMVAGSLLAQAPPPPFATGLKAPSKIIFTHPRNLIVAEGSLAPNSGRVSLIDRTSGTRRTLLDGLPSAAYTGTTPPSPTGVSGLALQGSTLYITMGGGNATVAGPVPSSEVPNPAGPASPIFSSVLSLKPSRPLDVLQGDFFLQPSQHAVLKSGSSVTLTNSAGEQLEVRLVADFPDFIASPRPDFPANVKNSNAFGAVVLGNTMFVVDASNNLIRRVNLSDGTFATLTTFPSFANPGPVGPPMIEAVPDSIRLRGNELLVTTLTGFPFPPGAAGVYRVDINSGAITTVVTGFTSAIDLEPLGEGSGSPLLVLEFSTSMTTGAPGRLRLVTPGNAPVSVAEGLVTPTGLAFDRKSGEAFVTLLGPGIVVRIPLAQSIPSSGPDAIVAGVASTSGANGSRWVTHSLMHNPYPFPISGRIVFHPQGRSAAAEDPSLAYVLAPFETRGFPDLVGAIGGSGLGSLDIITSVGGVPVMTVRIVDEDSADKPAALVPLLHPADALRPGFTGTVVSPPDVATQRFNIGIRTLEEGAVIALTQRGPTGETLKTMTLTFPPNYFVQLPANQLTGLAVGGRNSISFEVQQGSAFVYAAAVQNNGKGLIVQTARPIPSIF